MRKIYFTFGWKHRFYYFKSKVLHISLTQGFVIFKLCLFWTLKNIHHNKKESKIGNIQFERNFIAENVIWKAF